MIDFETMQMSVITIKPGKVEDFSINGVPMGEEACVIVTDEMHELLIKIFSPEGGSFTLCGGEGPLAGGDLVFELSAGSTVMIRPESGRYLCRAEDGTRYLHLKSTDGDAEVHAMALV